MAHVLLWSLIKLDTDANMVICVVAVWFNGLMFIAKEIGLLKSFEVTRDGLTVSHL